jgi:hypothetical protein
MTSPAVSQQRRTIQETLTTAAGAEVLEEAKRFFARQNGVYAAFPEQESANHLTLRGQGGEEIVIAVSGSAPTRVTGSTYLFDQQVARFLQSLPPAGTSGVIELGGQTPDHKPSG